MNIWWNFSLALLLRLKISYNLHRIIWILRGVMSSLINFILSTKTRLLKIPLIILCGTFNIGGTFILGGKFIIGGAFSLIFKKMTVHLVDCQYNLSDYFSKNLYSPLNPSVCFMNYWHLFLIIFSSIREPHSVNLQCLKYYLWKIWWLNSLWLLRPSFCFNDP